MNKAIYACLVVIIGALAAACSSAGASTPRSWQLFVDPVNPLLATAPPQAGDGRTTDAQALRALARVPQAIWAAGQPGDIQKIRQYAREAAAAHKIGLIVAYNLPHRDKCGGFSAKSGQTAQGYQAWIRQLAAAVGNGDDIVIVEPDAIYNIHCLSASEATEQYQLLRYAMRLLGNLPNAKVYLDAGNPGMYANPAIFAGPLKKAGIGYGNGFSANVSNFQWTAVTVRWAQRLERDLGMSHMQAVIDTSRNGNGPYTGPARKGPNWCNPPGRALGAQPTLNPGVHGIAAFLWIKDPAGSDGLCHGGPPAGQWWPEYAVSLWRNAHR